MIIFDGPRFTRKKVSKLLSFNKESKTFKEISSLQSDLCIAYDTKVVLVTSANDDYLAAAFSKAFANAYALNGKKALVIDANFYNPQLSGMLHLSNDSENDSAFNNVFNLEENIDVVCSKKEEYPGETIKSDAVGKLINENKDNYDHIIVIAPNLKEHEDALFFTKDAGCVLLTTKRNVTTKSLVYKSIQLFKDNKVSNYRIALIK